MPATDQSGSLPAASSPVAEKLQAKHHGVVALVDRCEKLDLVERRQGASDRRQVEIHLRPKGLELVHRLAGLHRPELRLLERIFGEALSHGDGAGRQRTQASA